ncbi:hypothetical protein HBI44_095620 [Parastagonospora nodorum]|nr:hypothetical protein HBI44_095620 [Parastagonospora nodorum]KAH6011418.1 hypothetical protein HBI83_160750 [Parastagonospora nodorum]KAH6215874.1 hypothetical protein HBI15_131380 [Parastagonospora nodorum]
MLSKPSYPNSGFAISAALAFHGIDFSALDKRTTHIAQVFVDRDGTFYDVETPSSLMLDFSHNASCPTTTPENKGYVTVSFKQVGAKVAHEITSSVLKYNDSLVVELYLE